MMEVQMYPMLLYIHILSAVLSIGPFFALIPLLSKIRSVDQVKLDPYLDCFRYVVRLAKHAGHILVISGILLMWIGKYDWLTSWIVLTILLLLGTLFFIARAFSPILRKFREPDHDRHHLVKKLARALLFYILIMLVLLWLMVAKPTLW
jgi:uncharacterized membrane protein